MPRLHPVNLALLLCLGISAARQPALGSAREPQLPLQPQALSQETPAGLNTLQGLPVAEVHIAGPSVEHPEWLEPLLVQKASQPLDKYKVRQSVQALYDTGRFAAIQVQAQRSAKGEVILIFDVRENYFFGSILSEGAPGRPSDNQLVSASKLALGDLYTEEKIKTGLDGMQHALQEGGYFQASVQPFLEWDSKNQQVKVLFVVTRGKPARVGQVLVTGSPGYSKEQIARIAGLKAGDRVTAGKATRSLQRIRKHLQKQDRLEGQVALTQRVYHPQNNSLDYTFDITPGPIVDVRVEGAKMRRGLVKKLVPVFEENAVDDDLLNEGKRNLQDYFQTKGYFDVKVNVSQKQIGESRVDVIFDIDKGEKHKFVELAIRGNHYFHRDDIRERIEMQPAGGVLVHGLFSQAMLNRDIAAIQTLYQTNGFLQAKVVSEVKDDFEGQKGHIQVILDIQEGPQTLVGKLAIEGNSVLSEKEIRSLVSAQEGQPYSASTVINDQTEVMNAYANRGFPNVRFEYLSAPDPGDAYRINLIYRITEGSQVFVDRVLISGLHFTRPFVVEREMQLHSGEPLSQRNMLDTQSRLYDMGIFNEVDMAVQNPDGEASHKNVNFQMTEAKRYTFNYGLGLEVQTGQPAGSTAPQGKTGVSPRVSFDVTRLNFRGRNHTVTLKTRYGNLEKLALIGFTEPRWFDSKNLALSFTAFYEQTNGVQTYTANRLEGAAEVRQTLNRATTLLYRMVYRRVSTSNLVIAPDQVPLFSQPVRVGMPDFSYIRDTRDNPIDSRKGSFNTFDIGIASNVFGSETNFVRVFLQNTTYYQFHKRRWVFARSTRIGIEEPFSDTSAAIAAPGPGAPAPSSFIPLPERFLSGGATSHRGFGVNQAGPRDLATGQPLGGEALFLNNLELRTPTIPLPYIGNNLSLVFFNDIGNVFTSPTDMVHNLARFVQQNRDGCLSPTATTCNFNYMSVAVGAGIRYRTPIGPVSFDMGYNLNPPAFPITAPPPPAVPASQVLKHFNFFFNIGQTF